MSIPFTVRFWGVRGSIATGGTAFAAVGGNTACVEVRAGNELIIVDAGTGVFGLGQSLPHPIRASFLFTHFHWDHIQGFPLFRPAYVEGNSFRVYGPGQDADEVEAVFARQMQAPNFPVPFDVLQARLEFGSLRPGDQIAIGPARVRTVALNHPQSCLAYRITVGTTSLVVATDTEPIEGSAVDPSVVELARGADLLIHDAQYTESEYEGRSGPSRKGWGHSTYDAACRVARAAGVKQLILFHHDPSHDDRYMEWIAIGASALFGDSVIAREGMAVDVHAVAATHALSSRIRSAAGAQSLHAA